MILHNKPTLGAEEEEAAKRVISSGDLVKGKELESFENEFCEFIGLPKGHAIAVSSGSNALFLSLWILGAKNKKISFPGYVCSALHHSVRMIGGSECLIDVSKNSPNVDLLQLKNSNSEISIIPHMFGIPIDLSGLDKNKIIEDCCQSIGAKVNDRYVGLTGKIGIFSFYATKLMTSGGQGGMIICKDSDIINSIRKFLDYDVMRDEYPRFNFQMTDLQAAIGREQLKKLPNFLLLREKIFNKYKKAGLNLLDVPDEDKDKLTPVRYRALLKCKNPQKMVKKLSSNGIKSIVPMEGWMDRTHFPNAFSLTTEYVSLPIYPLLSDDDVDFIISKIKE